METKHHLHPLEVVRDDRVTKDIGSALLSPVDSVR
jgi:hypothetical protein